MKNYIKYIVGILSILSTLSLSAQTAADDCAKPVPICGTIPLSESNIESTTVASDPSTSCAASVENTSWYTFITDGSGAPVTIDIAQVGCSGFGLQVHILSGVDCAGGFFEEDCISNTATGVYNLMLANPIPNTTYWVYVDGNGGGECAYTIQGGGGIAACCGPVVTYETSCDVCDEDNFYVDIIITDPGTDPSGYDVNGGLGLITAAGTITIGPFPNGMATITITGVTETDCVLISDITGDCTCPIAMDGAGNVILAVEAGNSVSIDCETSGVLTATQGLVLPGEFLGTYTVTEVAAACAVPPDSPADCVDLALGDDDGSIPIAIPFPFDFFGVTYTSLCVSSNGYVSFTCLDQTDLSEDPIPNATDPNAIIALFWDDLDPTDPISGTICTYSVMIGGQACFVTDYNMTSHFGGSETVTGQIIICEDGTVTTTCVDCQADGGTNTALQGIEDETGTTGYGYPGSPTGDGVTDGGDLTNCVTYVPDISADRTCTFVGWVTDPADIAGSTVSTSVSFAASPTVTTTYYAIVDCEGLLCKDEVTVTVTGGDCCDADNGVLTITKQ